MNNRIRIITGILLSALSGAMLLLSFPPYGIWPLAWIAFVPGVFAQYRLMPRKHSSIAPAIYLLIWLGPYMARLFGTEFGPVFTYLGVIIAVITYFINRERGFIERTGYRWMVLQGVAGWVGFEMVRTTFLPLVATSAFIGYTQATQPWLIQPVSVFSIYGLNTVVMLVNYALVQAAIAWYDRRGGDSESPVMDQRMSVRWLTAAGITLAAWIGISVVMLSGAPENPPTVRVAALRANYSLPAHHDEVNTDEVRFDTFSRQAYEAADQGAQIVFTSEMMFNFDPREKYTEEFRQIAAETDTWIFIAYSVIKEGEPSRNETVLLSPDGSFSEVYNKTHIPPGEAYDVPGGRYPVFETPYGTLAAMICADGNYTDVSRQLALNGAQLIGVGYKEFPGFGEQLWQNTIFRAVENHASLVVTGATSVAAIIDPYGKIVDLDVNKEGSEVVLVGDVSLGSGEGTLYTSLGDILGWVTMIGWVGLMVYQSVEERRWKKQAES